MKQLLKLVTLGFVALSVVGCASTGGISKRIVDNKTQIGTIYGIAAYDTGKIREACEAINNSDERCLEQDKYQLVSVISRFGFSDAAVGVVALADKNINIEKDCARPAFKKCTFYKAKVEPNKLGTVIEEVSKPTDNKCYWSGLNKAGGTVCPAYNYDYKKDFSGIVFH